MDLKQQKAIILQSLAAGFVTEAQRENLGFSGVLFEIETEGEAATIGGAPQMVTGRDGRAPLTKTARALLLDLLREILEGVEDGPARKAAARYFAPRRFRLLCMSREKVEEIEAARGRLDDV